MVFVNSHTRGLEWDKAVWKGQVIAKLFKEVFQFQKVEVHVDKTKNEIIREFEKLQRTIDKSEQQIQTGETLCVGVIWIGHTLYLNSHHKGMIYPKDHPPVECKDGTITPQ